MTHLKTAQTKLCQQHQLINDRLTGKFRCAQRKMLITNCCTFCCNFTQNAVNSVSQKYYSGNGSLNGDKFKLGENVDEEEEKWVK